MVDPLVLRPLERAQIPQAFPLVRAILPETSLARWTDFARTHTLDRGDRNARGIMVACNQAGYIAGLFTHEIRDELALGRTLAIASLMVADFPGRDATVDYLIEGMDALANLRGCAAIAATLDIALFDGAPTGAWAMQRFVQGGFAAAGTSQCWKVLRIPREARSLHSVPSRAASKEKFSQR